MSKFRNKKLNMSHELARSPENIRREVQSARTNAVVILVLDNKPFYKQISHTPARILPWNRARGASTVQLAIEAMLCEEGHTLYALTLNLSPSLAKTLRKSISLNYIRDAFRETIKSVLKAKLTHFVLVKESAGVDRTHFHGALLIPDELVSESLVVELEKAIGKSSLCRKYKEYFGNKAAHTSSFYKLKADPPGTKKPIDSGWGTYITKNYMRGKKHVMSTELARLSKDFSERIRKYEWHKLSDDQFRKLRHPSLCIG